jgi:hypothetical protein
MDIVRKELAADQLYAANLRYNDATDTVQVTADGGETWTDAPNSDPRNNSTFPPRVTADPQCDAAAAMVLHMQRILNAVISGITAASSTVVTAILSLFFPEFAILFVLIDAIVNALVSYGVEALNDMQSGTDWYKVECLIQANLDENGQLTQAAFDQIWAQVGVELDATNAGIVHYLMQMSGVGGLNYAASVGTATGDCEDCYCVSFTCTFNEALPSGWQELTSDQAIDGYKFGYGRLSTSDPLGQAFNNINCGAGGVIVGGGINGERARGACNTSFYPDNANTGRESTLIFVMPTPCNFASVKAWARGDRTGHLMQIRLYDQQKNLLEAVSCATNASFQQFSTTHANAAVKYVAFVGWSRQSGGTVDNIWSHLDFNIS